MHRQRAASLALAFALLLLVPCRAWVPFELASGSPVPDARAGHCAVVYGGSMVLFGGRVRVSETLDPPATAPTECAALDGCNGAAGTCVDDALCLCADGYTGERCETLEYDDFLSDLWSLDVSARVWTAAALPDEADVASGAVAWPDARHNHNCAVVGSDMIVFGGYAPTCEDYCGDTWRLPLAADAVASGWVRVDDGTQAASVGLTARFQAAAAVSGSDLYLFGGLARDSALSSDIFRLASGRWSLVPALSGASFDAPSPRLGAAALMLGDDLVVYGGYDGTTRGDVWTFSTRTMLWTQQSGGGVAALPAAMGARAAPLFGQLHVHGGRGNGDGLFFDGLWRYNETSGEWSEHHFHGSFRVLPRARHWHSLVEVPSLGGLLMFGGMAHGAAYGEAGNGAREVILGDTWLFDVAVCPVACNGRGACSLGSCICAAGFYGEDCQRVVCDSGCSGRGECFNGVCKCLPGFIGAGCAVLSCPGECNARGECVEPAPAETPVCECDSGFFGSACQYALCPNACSGRGTCEYSTGTCACLTTQSGRYSGDDCSEFFASPARHSCGPPSASASLAAAAAAILLSLHWFRV